MLIRNASASSAIVSIRPFFVVPHFSAQIVDMGTPEIRDSCAADNLALLRALRILSPLVITILCFLLLALPPSARVSALHSAGSIRTGALQYASRTENTPS